MTKEIEAELSKRPIGSRDEKGMEVETVVKYFNPYGDGTWLIMEGENTENGDRMLHGYCHIFEWEWGMVMLSDLEAFCAPPFEGIERGLHIGRHAKVKEPAWCGGRR